MISNLFLVRHAESEANAQNLFSSRKINPPLTPYGLRQANQQAQILKTKNIERIYTSPLKRALQTAQIVGEQCKVTPVPIKELMEVDVGLLDGLSWLDSVNKEIYIRVVKEWEEGHDYCRFEGGESLAEVKNRIEKIRGLISDNNGLPVGQTENIVLVGHAGLFMIAIPTLCGLPLNPLEKYRLPRASIMVIKMWDKKLNIEQVIDLSQIP